MPDETFQGGAPQGLLQEDQEYEELSTPGLLSLEHTLAGTVPDEASRPARRAAEARVVDILRADNFQGPRYEKTTTRLMDYGWRTINKWIASGEIFAHARRPADPSPRT